MKLRNFYIQSFYDGQCCNTSLSRLKLILLHGLVAVLPLHIAYSNIVLGCYIMVSLIDYKDLRFRSLGVKTLLLQGIFYLSAIGYWYSAHPHEAGLYLERQLLILLLPIILPISLPLTLKQVYPLLMTLALSCVLAILYLFTNMLLLIHEHFGTVTANVMLSGAFFNHRFSAALGIHAGYLSLYTVLGLIVVIDLYRIQSMLINKIVPWLLIVILSTGMFFLASRNTSIALLIILALVIPFFIRTQRRIYYLLITVFIFTGLALTVYYTPFLKERFSAQLISDIKPLKGGSEINFQNMEPRIERWKCAWDIVLKAPVWGHGTGDEIAQLKQAYHQKGLFISELYDLNAHNTYLSMAIKHGFAGFIAFLMLMFVYVSWALRARHFIYLSFLLVYLIGFYTENLLDTNKGIVCFALLNTLLGYSVIPLAAPAKALNLPS